jgi:hypothetical protein
VPERFRAKTRGFLYPVGEDLARVLRVGGVSQLTDEERNAMGPRLRRVEIGEFCDDMPAAALARYLELGDVERVCVESAAAFSAVEGVVGFRDFGASTPVTLHGVETVVTKDGTERIDESTLSDLDAK